MSFYGGILLKKCMQTNTCITSYEDIAEQAFGWKGRIMVWIMVNLELYLTAIGLLIMEGDNLHKLFPNFALKFGQITIGGRLLFVIITIFVILPSLLSTDLDTVSYITAVGLFSIIIIIASLLFVGSASGVWFHGKGKLLSVGGIPTSIALYVSCFGGHPVIPTVYMSMQDTGQFTKAMLVSFFFNTIVYLSMAIVGYLMYGNNVDSPITLNLPTEEISSKVAIYTTLVIPVTRYALLVSPVANAIESGPLHCYRNTRRIRFLIRISILVSTTMVACAFPYFEFLMVVVGSTLVVFASFLLPCCCYLKISRGYQISRS
ncbi:hypothetical protein F0562_000045 [Nyssa sinensis]|uniref:Amino acid transporter transmembrane domain-containing protein n=1 Tax=Nyssa sinensis TaxID=561372 RepID=A0A5J5C433_9ASTE|nr:hypothetical protein F0562_000045 [Nyssa sinensis]